MHLRPSAIRQCGCSSLTNRQICDEIPLFEDEMPVWHFVADWQLRRKKRDFVAVYGISSQYCAFCRKMLHFLFIYAMMILRRSKDCPTPNSMLDSKGIDRTKHFLH